MLKYALTVIVVFLFIFAGYIFITDISKIKFIVQKTEEKEYLPGEKIKIDIEITNSGIRGDYFFINLKSDLGRFIPETVYLQPKESYKTQYQTEISKNIQPGIYEIKTSVKSRQIYPFTLKSKPREVAKKIITIKVKEQERPKVVSLILEKKPEPFMAKFNSISIPEKLTYNATNFIRISVENVSSTEGKTTLWLDIAGPQNSKMVFSYTLTLGAKETKEKTFEYLVDEKYPVGKYFISLELRETLNDKLLSSDVRIAELNDLPPNLILNQIDIKKEPKTQIEIKYEISDDIEVEEANLWYYDLKKEKINTYTMNLISGTKKQGIWSCRIYPDKKIKQFKYYISAIDNRNQENKTTEQTISLTKK
ncbi:MAG: hypothetical protein ACK4JE_01545 [Endomicrobiia bacterium]